VPAPEKAEGTPGLSNGQADAFTDSSQAADILLKEVADTENVPS
jgi:hypothetical protein